MKIYRHPHSVVLPADAFTLNTTVWILRHLIWTVEAIVYMISNICLTWGRCNGLSNSPYNDDDDVFGRKVNIMGSTMYIK